MKKLTRVLSVLLIAVMLFAAFGTAFTASAATPLAHKVQLDSEWKSVYVGGASLYKTGCGIFSLSNAVGYLTGKRIDITTAAKWAHSIGGFNVSGGDGTYRLVLYPKVQAKYGAQYGFTLNHNNGQGWWAGSSSSLLKSHLANGGVAIGHVPGHFIALVDYNYNTNKFHVLDSAPSTARGTTSGRGDCWVTQARLNTGKLKLDWFCLLSATGTPADEQDNEKGLLASAIQTAQDKRYDEYTPAGVDSLRSAYNNAVAVYNNASSTSANYKTARTALEAAMKGSDTAIISKGKAYTTSAVFNSEGDQKDDGVKLTDGSKSNADGGTPKFVGFKNGAQITVDLGSVQKSNMYKIYMTAGDWGIAVPYGDQLSMNISVSDSKDGPYTEIATANNSIRTGVMAGNWQTVTLTATLDTAVNARYVRFDIASSASNNFVWLDEVEVISGEPLLSGNVYINGINQKIGSGDCFVFTPSFGTITVDNANHAWTANIVAKWDSEKNGFVVTSKTFGNGSATPSITLNSDSILICANNWETGVTEGAVKGSAANTNTLNSVQLGDVITLDGVNVSSSKIEVVSYAKISTAVVAPEDKPEHVHTPGPESCDAPQICLTCNEVLAEAKGHDEGEWEIEENLKHLKCTVCGEVIKVEEIEIVVTVGMRGDVNDSGDIDSMDYVLLKRHYFNTFDLDEKALKRANVDANDVVDSTDYVLVKRAYFGTYTIQNPAVYY